MTKLNEFEPRLELVLRVSANAGREEARVSAMWLEIAAMEEAFASGVTTEGERVSGPPGRVETPTEHRARRAAVMEAAKALELAKTRVRGAAKSGANRAECRGLRIVVGMREAALKRLAVPG
jgi:hypothetical protein